MTKTTVDTSTYDKAPEGFPELNPFDEHNREALANLHPQDWTNPTPDGRYNLLVIGAGPGGLVAAAGAAGLGAKVALVEKHLLGGDCTNVGCVPSKALLRCARAHAEARDAGAFGVRISGDIDVDFAAVMERMRKLRAGISHHDSARRFTDLGMDMFLGSGQFTSESTFEIDGRTIEFARACIATGARAVKLPIEGIDEVDVLTNENIFTLTELPKRLVIIGAGPIGVEMAQAFARFGSEVTLLEQMPQILIKEDEDAARLVEAQLERDGVEIICCADIQRLSQDGADTVMSLKYKDGHDKQRGKQMPTELRVDRVLIGVGRKPNTEGLGLETAGVETWQHGVKVNDYLQTSNKRIYAIGDVASKYKFTHAADAMARIVIRNALLFGRARHDDLIVPWCTYSEPEIAHVGINEQEAKDRDDVTTIKIDFADVDRAKLDGQTNGFVKVHADGKGRILGATIVGADAGNMIGEIVLAMQGGLKLSTVADAIHPYPTVAEAIKKAGDAYNRTRLTPTVKRLFETVMKWRR